MALHFKNLINKNIYKVVGYRYVCKIFSNMQKHDVLMKSCNAEGDLSVYRLVLSTMYTIVALLLKLEVLVKGKGALPPLNIIESVYRWTLPLKIMTDFALEQKDTTHFEGEHIQYNTRWV